MRRSDVIVLPQSIYQPGEAGKKSPMQGLVQGLLAGKPNRKRTIEERVFDAERKLTESLHFLAGVLTVYQFQNVQLPLLKLDAEKLWHQGQKMRSRLEISTAYIQKLRKRQEQIDRLIQKIERQAKRTRAGQ